MRKAAASREKKPREIVVLLDPFNGGLSAARALTRLAERVVVVAGTANAHIARVGGVEGHVVPFGRDGESWAEFFLQLARERPFVVLTGGDVASAWLARSRGWLPAGVRTFEALDDAHVMLMDKASAGAAAGAAGVRVPWTRSVQTVDELDEIAADAPWPCVVKPVLSHVWRSHFGDRRVLLVRNAAEARAAVKRPLAQGVALLLSEYVPGGDDHVEEAIVVRAADGSYPVQFGCRKIRQYPVGFGAASFCELAELPASLALARTVLDHVGFVGVAGVETKRHAESGLHYFLEANVRIPTQWGLGDASGLEASTRLLATLRGEHLGAQPPPRRHARLVFPELELRALADAIRHTPGHRRLGVAARFARSYGGSRDFGILDPRDPVPGLALVVSALRRRVRHRRQGLLEHLPHLRHDRRPHLDRNRGRGTR